MNSAELRERLQILGPSDLERLLQITVKDHIDRDPEAAAVFQSTETLAAGLQQAAVDAGLASGAVAEPLDKLEVLRAIALDLADEPRYAAFLSNALASVRPTRVDPVTASIVLAGIVLVLQTRFDVRYHDHNGKKKLSIAIAKAPTSEKLLSKFFDLFKIHK